MPAEEQVLVIARSVFEKHGAFNGVRYDINAYMNDIFAPGVPFFMPRSQAETDPNYKQIIPYVIMCCGDRYLSYVRGKRAGESRLVGNRSIGIGGHINPIDAAAQTEEDFFCTYLAAVEREVNEEVIVETKFSNHIAGLLNDDRNEVGQVHLGIVHLLFLDEPLVKRREQMITQLAFMTLDELKANRDSMETWSALCVDQLEQMHQCKDHHLEIETR